MNVVEKNAGTKIEYDVNGSKLSFADDELVINLARYQKDEVVTKDIMVDADGFLVMGQGRYYAAQVEIPEKEYDETVTTVTETVDGEEVEKEVVNRTAKPLDMDKVTLYLFSIDGIYIN